MKRGDFSASSRMIFLAALSLWIGAIASLVALGLLHLIDFFTNLFFYGRFSIAPASPAHNQLGAWVIAIPALGGLIIGVMARYGSDRIRGHGIPEALEAILFGKSIMSPKVAVLKPISSALSIGTGGPFGAEGPIIMTGGAFGSLIAQAFELTSAERKTLLVAGAAAGMSTIFASPLAAIFLAVELLLFEWKPRSVFPVAVASITGATLRPFLLGAGPIFPLMAPAFAVDPQGLLSCCLLGVVAGLFSAAVSFLLYKLEDAFHLLPIHWMWWCAIGGLFVGIGGYFQPRALGVGYDVIQDLLAGKIIGAAALKLLLVKCAIWVVALASGTSGGVLAPLLMMGCGLGALLGPSLAPGLHALYPLVALAAVMGGTMRAPFTAVIFALEITHNVDALLPAAAATVVAYAVTVLLMKRSILTEKIARRGYHLFCEYGLDPLETTQVSEVMSRADSCLAAKPRVPRVTPESTCREAAEAMALHAIEELLVVDPLDGGRLVGSVSSRDLLKARKRHHESEQRRERVFLKARTAGP